VQTEPQGGLCPDGDRSAGSDDNSLGADSSPEGGDAHADRRLASPELADTLPDRYCSDSGEPLSLNEATERYRNHRIGEEASAEINGYSGSLYRRAKRKCALVHHADRRFRAQMDDPSMLLLTFAGSWDPTDEEYGPLLEYELALAEAIDAAWSTVRYRLFRGYEAEYVLIEAGTDQGVPHWHLLVWTEADAELRANAEVALGRFQAELPADLREFDPDQDTAVPDGTVLVDEAPYSDPESYPGDGENGPVSGFGRYVANQLPHLGLADRDLDAFAGMSEDDARYGAVADVSPTEGWRASRAVSRGGRSNRGGPRNRPGRNSGRATVPCSRRPRRVPPPIASRKRRMGEHSALVRTRRLG